jgi:hypothetical protein
MLRQGIRQYCGIRSERLTEFGLNPFRGKTGRKQPEGPPPPPPRWSSPSVNISTLLFVMTLVADIF